MVALIVGVVCIAFTVFSVLPEGLGWGPQAIEFLEGCAPFLAGFIGVVALFIGVADLKDKLDSRRAKAASEAADAAAAGKK